MTNTDDLSFQFKRNQSKLIAEGEFLEQRAKDLKDNTERDSLYIQSYRNKVIDLKISNSDRIIDLEIFLLKVAIPLFGISFTATGTFFGINIEDLKQFSFVVIVSVGLVTLITFFLRSEIVNAEVKKYNKDVANIKKGIEDGVAWIENKQKKISEDLDAMVKNGAEIELRNHPK